MTILPLKNVKTGDPQRSGTFPDWGWVVWIFGHPLKVRLEKKKCNRKTGRCWIKKNKQKKHCALMDSQGAARRGRGRWHMFSVGRGSHRNVFNGTDKSLLLWLAGPLVNSSRPLFFFFFFLAALKMAAGSVPVSSVPFPTLLLSPWWWLQQQPAWQWGLSEAGG